MPFRFGERSRRELVGVHDHAVEVFELTLRRSAVDFGVFDGLRSAAQQNALYVRGLSQLDGYDRLGQHQVQPSTGKGHAGDLVPWINGKFVWDWPAIYEIARALQSAANDLEINMRWGGCWQHVNPLMGSPEHWVTAYVKRKLSAGKRAFNDGPHFELYGAQYNPHQPDLTSLKVAA